MLVAVWDHSMGTSTSRCSKIVEPLSLPMDAVRVSQWISSYGVLPASRRAVKYRGNSIPVFVLERFLVFNDSIFALRSTESWPMSNPPDSLLERNASVMLPQHVVARQEVYLYAGCTGYKDRVRAITNYTRSACQEETEL